MTDLLAPVAAVAAGDAPALATAPAPAAATAGSRFGELVLSGLQATSAQSATATDALARYAAGEAVSPHELMISMEQARLSLQLTVEIRNRLVEAYQELTRMQI